MNDRAAFAAHAVAFSLVPWAFLLGTLVFAPLWYVAFICFPLSNYQFQLGYGAKTVFHHERYQFLSEVIYSLLLGIAAAYLLRRFSRLPRWLAYSLAFAAPVIVGFLLSHAFAWIRGYEYMLE